MLYLSAMRLEKIKLAGFKSFVDPTTVQFPSNLVGIVGPNGCGKSNVIDAVRWVMGESSAKMLRGESMADVIFNGSSSRKPVGTASIELVFDNSDGGAGGQYAQYSQIAVKRQVSRDGQSIYSLNNVRCRRRDIADLFLGTGLGPRSYSIIEQGMISRIIESKPEELRGYLEEAAGISKYKERRRETERRIGHTRENLERLNDLMEEIQKQLRHLERQAATAEKYKSLKQEERQVRAELLVLRLIDMTADLDQRDRAIQEQETKLQSLVARQRQIESDIESRRESHQQANEQFNQVQGQFYSIGADIARLEEAIQFAKETRRQQQTDLQQARQTLDNAKSHRRHDNARLEELAGALETDQPQLEQAMSRVDTATERLSQAEAEMHQWQTDWDQFNQRAAEPAQLAQVERTRINHFEQQEEQFKRRLERLEEEREGLLDARLQVEIKELEQRETERIAEVETLQAAAADLAQQIDSARDNASSHQATLAEMRTGLETTKGRLASLQALQQSALGLSAGSNGKKAGVPAWLEQQQLTEAKRLLELIEVDTRWQTAVEIVLGDLLQSICVDQLKDLSGSIADLESGRLLLMETGTENQVSAREQTLASAVRGPAGVIQYLNSVLMAEDLGDALDRRQGLGASETLITDEGLQMGKAWLSWRPAGDQGEDVAAGMIAREQEIRELTSRLQGLESSATALKEQLEDAQSILADAEQLRDQGQASLDTANRSLAEVRAQLSGRRARAEQIRHRIQGMDKDIEEIRQQLSEDSAETALSRQRLHQALSDMEDLAEQRETLVAARERYRVALEQSRTEASQARNASHEIALRVESMRSSEQSLRTGIERIHDQLQQLEVRCADLQAGLDASVEPLQHQVQELESKLQDRVETETRLTTARTRLSDLDHQLRALEQNRHHAEQDVQQQRSKLDQIRMDRQEVQVRTKTIEEQLAETGFERTELEGSLAEDARVSDWQERVERLASQIQRLGPINLAAIDEFKEQTERMNYLESQHADVTKALDTLEDAMRKIDRETRTRFKETFDRVNAGLKDLFPKLFGGGHAYLELTGEDLLDTGVTVMARPPGKRNSSIHLLSGGEKAMSAVALVFSIFQLNPAPFCMLDEVDAPLDDANVARFCNMVRSMSESVQFIFITHNKVTMEIANQLSGITMYEPGVSRLVSVDVEEAATLAAM